MLFSALSSPCHTPSWNTSISEAEGTASQIIQCRSLTRCSTRMETQLGNVNKYQVAITPCWRHSKLVALLIHAKSKHTSLRLFEIRDTTALKFKDEPKVNSTLCFKNGKHHPKRMV